MNKIKQLTLSLLLLLTIPTAALAVDSLAVQVFQPKSPTNVDNFELKFVALDVNNSPVTVKCFKKSPSDGSFLQFDGDKVLGNGGNSGYCSVAGSILNTEGTYQFYVEANGIKSAEVSVDYKTSTPGTPNSYSKNKINACDYTIKVKTDNDGGKTSKVVLYRSDSLSFSADSGTQVDSRHVGSDTWVEMTNSAPDCNKTYYFAVRAFNSAGNGSGIIGDENIVVTSSSSTSTVTGASSAPSTTGGGALLVESSGVSPETTPSPAAEQEIVVSPSPEILGTQTATPFWKSNLFRFGIIALLIGFLLAKRKK